MSKETMSRKTYQPKAIAVLNDAIEEIDGCLSIPQAEAMQLIKSKYELIAKKAELLAKYYQ